MNTDEIDWSLPARLRRIAQVFGDALNVEAADHIELLERELNAWKSGAYAEQRRAIRAEDALHKPPETTDARRIDNLRRIHADKSVNDFARSICGEAAARLEELTTVSSTPTFPFEAVGLVIGVKDGDPLSSFEREIPIGNHILYIAKDGCVALSNPPGGVSVKCEGRVR